MPTPRASRTCEFGDIMDEMIRDRIALGTKDQSVRGCLLKESTLTLNGAVEMYRTSERTSCAVSWRSYKDTVKMIITHLCLVNYAARRNKKHTPKQNDTKATIASKEDRCKMQILWWKHVRSRNTCKCPAYGKSCSICNKIKHFFSSVYQSSSKNVRQ